MNQNKIKSRNERKSTSCVEDGHDGRKKKRSFMSTIKRRLSLQKHVGRNHDDDKTNGVVVINGTSSSGESSHENGIQFTNGNDYTNHDVIAPRSDVSNAHIETITHQTSANINDNITRTSLIQNNNNVVNQSHRDNEHEPELNTSVTNELVQNGTISRLHDYEQSLNERLNNSCVWRSSHIYENDDVLQKPAGRKIIEEFATLASKSWYWGPLDSKEAEERLAGHPDGTFLVRDSGADHYILSISFRCHGRTLHTRLDVDFITGTFSLFPNQSYNSVVDLVLDMIKKSEDHDIMFGQPAHTLQQYPILIEKPLSRFTQVRSLKSLTRFVIRQTIRKDRLENLPLPISVKEYLDQKYFT